MNSSLEAKALGLALIVASASLGGAWGSAFFIQSHVTFVSSDFQGESLPGDITSSPVLIAQGREFFTMSCAECHGDDALGGDEAPNLHHLVISNARIAKTIKKGIKDEMPMFAKKYDAHQILSLIAYLRSLH
ncbi:MAG: c-type cytochrome [Methylacidiphilales bacterium]|nr:c-type cytochrome [Candidatus Methylacidiphilales bacterium]